MAKLTSAERSARRELRTIFENDYSGVMVTKPEYGLTIVVADHLYLDGKAIVSVAYCMPDSEFNRKKGELLALRKMIKGDETRLFVLPYHSDITMLGITDAVAVMYCRLYNLCIE